MSTVSPVDSEREKEVENRLDLGKSKVTSFYIHHGGLPELQVLYIKLQPPKGVAQGLAWLEESLDPTYPLVGLDCELGESSVRLLQLSTRSRCVIIRIPKQVTREAIPPELEAFLGHRTVIKSGVELWGNALDLYRDLGIATNGNLDASFIYSQNQGGHTPSLERLTNQVLGQNAFVRDREISCANWDTKPTKKQLEYAALNAQASFLIGARREVLTQLRPFHISDMSATWLEEVGRLRVEMNANQRKEEEELPVEYESIELINRRSVKVILKKSSPLIRQGSLMKLYYSNGLKHPCQVLRYEEDSARILLPRGCTTQAFPVSHVCKVTLLHEKQKEQVEFHDKLWQYIRDYLYGNQNQVRRLSGTSNTSLVVPLPITPFSPQTYPSTFTPYDDGQSLASLETQAPYHPLDSEASSSQLGSEEEQDEERNQSSDTKRDLCGSQFPGPGDDDDLNLIEDVLKEWEFEEERVKDPMREEKTPWEPSDVISTKDKPLKEEQKEEQVSGDDSLAALQSSSSPIKGDVVVSSPLARPIQRPKSREGSSNSLFSPSFSTPFHMLSPRVFPPPFSLPSSPLGDEGVKWVCPKCMVVNPLTSFKCQTCETPIPKLLVAPESLTSKFSVSGRLQQAYPLSSSDVETESDGVSSRRSSMTSSPQVEEKDKKDTLSKRKAEKVKSLWDSPDVKAKLVSKIETKDRGTRKSTPPSNYKIALCFDFKTRNFCRNGKKCSFAHGLSELRRPLSESKTEMCSYQKSGEPCPNRENCTLSHDASEVPEKGSSETKVDAEKRQKETERPSSSPPTSKKMKPRKISLKELEQKPSTDSSKEDIVRPLAYKTELCSFYIKLRRCRNGKDCNYAHGEAELRKPDESALPNGGSRLSYKTELCRHWNEKGECWLEEKCKFAHGEGELRKYESDEGKAKLRLRKSDLRIVNNDEASKDKPADHQKKKQPKKEKPKESDVMATLRTMWKGTPTHAPDSNSTGN